MARHDASRGVAEQGSRAHDTDAESVIIALKSVIDSAAFRSAWRARDFLVYVVTETLNGRGHALSERTIGRWALGRGASFDGRTDSSVRVQARRVRQGLDQYYATEGARDAIRIDLPVGTYVPVFVSSSVVPETVQGLEPGVVLLVPEARGDVRADLIGRALIEALAQRLSSFTGLRVVGPTEVRGRDAQRVAASLGATTALSGTVLVRDRVTRLNLRLVDAASGEVLWAATETRDIDAFAGFEAEDEWATAVAGQLGDFAGVLLKHARNSAGPQTHAGWDAAMAFYATIESGTPDAFHRAASALDVALAEGPRLPLLVAMRGSVLAVMAAYGLTDDADDAFHRADMLAREALADDPQLWLGHMVLATTAVGRLRWGDAVAHVDDAVRLAPEHPTALMSGALICIRAGEWEQATAMADEALRLNPGLPAYVHTLAAVGRLLADDDAGALAEASLVHVEGMFWGPLYRALALAGLGRLDEGWREMKEAVRLNPQILEDPRAFLLGGFRLDADQLETMLRHFEPFTAARKNAPSSEDDPSGDDGSMGG